MGRDGVSVGHASQVIAHRAVPAFLARPLAGLLADFRVMLQKVTKQITQHLDRSQIGLMHLRIVIEVFVEVFPQFRIQLLSFRTVLD
jgi:hypothetical protein